MIIFLLLPLLGLAYAGWHVYVLLPLPHVWRWSIIGLGVGSFLLIFCNFSRLIDRMPMCVARLVYDLGNSSVFILLYLVMIFLLIDAGRLLHIVPRYLWYQSFVGTVGVTLLMTCLFFYGNMRYHHKVREELTLTTDKPLQHPLKVVMMSDLHLGYHNPRTEMARWVDMVNAEKPDLVLIAGDIIDISVRPLIEEGVAEEFHRLQAPVYACLGNHEYYSQEPLAVRFFSEAGIHLLRDTSVVAGDLCIIGRDDRTNGRRRTIADLAAGADMQRYTILLDHQPYHLEQAERMGIDFQLSGHTHHGQVWPISWITEYLYECAFGSHQRGKTRYYVSSGMGIWGGKFRIGTRSEYVVATIRN